MILGTKPIGWWLHATDGKTITDVIDGGRIFSDGRDPKPEASRAVDCRAPDRKPQRAPVAGESFRRNAAAPARPFFNQSLKPRPKRAWQRR